LVTKKVGVLALQGDVEKHVAMLNECGSDAILVRSKEDLCRLSGLIIPGGESTTIGKLLVRFELFSPIQELLQKGLPVYGTCAGLILLAREIVGLDQPSFAFLDITVARNAYGSQVESFEADISVPCVGEKPVRGVFIRAPIIERAGESVQVLARFEDAPVLVQQKKILGGTFHPELTDDLRIHQYFLSLI
jgi:5'-phosphate synthase pdxT subunit